MKSWHEGSIDFDWEKMMSYVLGLEGSEASPKNLEKRKRQIKDKVKDICPLNLSKLNTGYCDQFDIVQSNFCCESATDDISEYLHMLDNMYKYLKKGGHLIMTALEGSIAYKSGKSLFPSIYLDEELIGEYLHGAGFKILSIKNVKASNPAVSKYHGFLLIKACK